MKKQDVTGPLTRKIKKVLILSGDPEVARRDRSILRSLRIHATKELTSGVAAARYLMDKRVDLVICDKELDDMSGVEFVQMMRKHPDHAALAMVLASPDNSREAVYGALGSGCSGYLIRPYSIKAVCTQVERALELSMHARAHAEMTPRDASPEAFEEALRKHTGDGASGNMAAYFNRLGRSLFTREQYDRAIDAFHAALGESPDDPEALVGLGRAWKAKGWPDRFRDYMNKAALVYMDKQRYDKARLVYEMVRKLAPNAPNPFYGRACTALRKNDLATAARGFELAALCAPDNGDRSQLKILAQTIARACQYADAPAETAQALCREYQLMGRVKSAATLYRHVMGPEPATNAASDSSRKRWLKKIKVPLPQVVGDICAVAKFTMKSYFHGEPQPAQALAKVAEER